MNTTTTAKLHVSPDIAELVKIYCVLTKQKMSDYASAVFEKELKSFKENLIQLRKIEA